MVKEHKCKAKKAVIEYQDNNTEVVEIKVWRCKGCNAIMTVVPTGRRYPRA